MAASDQQKQGIILLSGGVDSTTLLWEYAADIALAVSFNYGSKHNRRELSCAEYQCKQLDVEHLVIPLDFINRYFRSDLLKSGGELKLGSYDAENMASTVVPFRNGVMLSVVAGLAESRQLKRLYIANHSGDHFIYPDCRPAFVEAMSRAIGEGTTNSVELCAPYTLLSKAQIVFRGAHLGVDFAHTYSCYQGGEQHCGVCGTCRERRDAFAEAKVSDPTVYLSKP